MKQRKNLKKNAQRRAHDELRLMGGRSATSREKKIESTYQKYYIGGPTVEKVMNLRRREAIKLKFKRFFRKFKRN